MHVRVERKVRSACLEDKASWATIRSTLPLQEDGHDSTRSDDDSAELAGCDGLPFHPVGRRSVPFHRPPPPPPFRPRSARCSNNPCACTRALRVGRGRLVPLQQHLPPLPPPIARRAVPCSGRPDPPPPPPASACSAPPTARAIVSCLNSPAALYSNAPAISSPDSDRSESQVELRLRPLNSAATGNRNSPTATARRVLPVQHHLEQRRATEVTRRLHRFDHLLKRHVPLGGGRQHRLPHPPQRQGGRSERRPDRPAAHQRVDEKPISPSVSTRVRWPATGTPPPRRSDRQRQQRLPAGRAQRHEQRRLLTAQRPQPRGQLAGSVSGSGKAPRKVGTAGRGRSLGNSRGQADSRCFQAN